jgi:hypothetical protein
VRLIFLEDRAQVAGVRVSGAVDADTTLVAITAEALDALDELGLSGVPVSSFAHPRVLADAQRDYLSAAKRLLEDVESFVVERHPSARLEGPGFLMAQDYNVQVSIVAIATRAYLMREAIRALGPASVAAFPTTNERLFLGDGYPEAPWIAVLEELSRTERFRLERLALRPKSSARPRGPSALLPRARVAARLGVQGLASQLAVPFRSRRTPDGRGLRLLFVGPPQFDWVQVVEHLGRRGECFWIPTAFLDPNRDWTEFLGNELRTLGTRRVTPLGPAFEPDEAEADVVRRLVTELLGSRNEKLDVLGIDILPALIPNLVAIASLSPAIVRHADAVAERALDMARPDALCFASATLAPAKRVAHLAAARRIDAVAYQHGGAYSTHEWVAHELGEWAHVDHFLTYGEGIQPPAQPLFPLRAHFVPVGSARISSWRGPRRRTTVVSGKAQRVLWIAETASRNVVNYALVEDTERYLLERRCLELLDAAGVNVTFRAYPGQWETSGVLGWLRRRGLQRVRVDEHASVRRLIARADLVVSDAASGTVWNEVLALGKPFILYCDPETARLLPDFAADLERACHWCRSEDEFIAELESLTTKSYDARDQGDVERFLERYVLHHGRPADAVATFLATRD